MLKAFTINLPNTQRDKRESIRERERGRKECERDSIVLLNLPKTLATILHYGFQI